jgi:hypothetical protein
VVASAIFLRTLHMISLSDQNCSIAVAWMMTKVEVEPSMTIYTRSRAYIAIVGQPLASSTWYPSTFFLILPPTAVTTRSHLHDLNERKVEPLSFWDVCGLGFGIFTLSALYVDHVLVVSEEYFLIQPEHGPVLGYLAV